MAGRGTPSPGGGGSPSGDRREGDGSDPSAGERGSTPGRRRGPPPVAINDVLDGRYRLQSRIREGGMGAVYLAHDLRLDKPVAVKVLLASLAGRRKAETAKRMLQEAHAASRVTHSALVQMLDLGTAPNGDPYLVMELLRGDSLSTMLVGRGFLEPAEAVQILLPVAHGLAAAHDQKVVHRDLKPENILLAFNPDGSVQPKVIDFGLAKARIEHQARLTKRGRALGTPEYMSPEQVRGEDVTLRADVWGFCVLLYELVAGEAPFRGRQLKSVLKRVLRAEPTPITHLGCGDEKLWRIIERGLSKDPAKRWHDMRELGEALARWLLAQGERRDVCGKLVEKRWLKRGAEQAPGSAAAAAQSPLPRAAQEPAAPSPAKPASGVASGAAAPQSSTPAGPPAQRSDGPLIAVLLVVAALGVVAAVLGYLGIF